MRSIDPTTCKPGAYRIRIGDRDVNALLLPNGSRRWAAPSGHALSIAGVEFLPHAEVNVLHRLVPESEEKALDVPMPQWETLWEAASIYERVNGLTPGSMNGVSGILRETADVLEAEHRAAQEEAAADAAREALIVKAATVLFQRRHGDVSLDQATNQVRAEYIDEARTLADAGLLAEAGEDRG